MVEELSSYTPGDLADLDALMQELSATSYCDELLLSNALNDANVHVYVIRDGGHIIATATLCVMHTLEFTVGDVESVVVSSRCRGLGYSKELMRALIEAAKGLGVHHLQLTSHSGRVAANGLYRALGFEQYETNCYRMKLM
jgi:N-acetylglutamate synthase-like GNAT family acetyltransferase